MSRVLRLRRGTTAETAAFTGKLAEVSVDTDTFSLVVHDNVTPGGHRIATEAYVENNKAVTSSGNTAPIDATSGSMWFDTESGRLYVYYNNSWIDASPTVQSNQIGNLVINDTTISSEGTNKSITLSPTGTGNVNLNANVHIEAAYLRIGNNDELVVRYADGNPNANPYNRVSITTALNSNANIGLSLSSTTDSFMFFNPETGRIGVNTRNPLHSFTVNGSFQAGGIRSTGGIEANAEIQTGFSFYGNTVSGITGLYHNIGGDNIGRLLMQHNSIVGLAIRDDGIAELPRNLHIGDNPSFTPTNARVVYGDDVEGFTQFAMQNKNSGTGSSTDISLFADNGNDDHNFVDMGITSSNYNDPIYSLYGPNDAYLLSAADSGTKLILNTYNDADIVFATGGTLASNEIARFQNGEGLVMHGNVIPASNVAYNLGSPGNEWRSLYVSDSTIYLGGVPLGLSNGNLTVDGNVIGGATPPSSTAPNNPQPGQLWFDSITGHLFVRYSDTWIDTAINFPTYTPTTPSDWNATPPVTLAAAIDRLAAAVKALNGGTGA